MKVIIFLIFLYFISPKTHLIITTTIIDLIQDPICLIGAIISKVALSDRPYCIEIENKIFIDARTSTTQMAWINALFQEIDDVSYEYLISGKPSAKNELALWFGKLLGRKQTCITILQQRFVVVNSFFF